MSPPPEVSLRDIADWQKRPEDAGAFRVDLPKLQRGFVWEPSKIMDLWDSLLRGFPIGSMMISSIDPDPDNQAGGNSSYWLLDGQQRATSIAIGFRNPWEHPGDLDPLWNHKDRQAPLLWLDLDPERRDSDPKLFFPFLITQSHPWGYDRDGAVLPWSRRREACDALQLGENYTAADLCQCFPWGAELPYPMGILLDIAGNDEIRTVDDFWAALHEPAPHLGPAWRKKTHEPMGGAPPPGLAKILQGLRRTRDLRVHLNLLTGEAAENDAHTEDDNSLLFVRLNTGGVVLGGEELIFSLFKSAFPQAKDAVEACAMEFMAPSKLFGLLVRLAAAEEDLPKLARPVALRDFKRQIRMSGDPLKPALKKLIKTSKHDSECEAARLMCRAKDILCGEGEAFRLPQALATRTINESPEVFLALLYWLRAKDAKKQSVAPGSDEDRALLGRFTALSWFLPGNVRAKQQVLREWVKGAGPDPAGRMWTPECLSFLFLRDDVCMPVLPPPEALDSFLQRNVAEHPDGRNYRYEEIPAADPAAPLWDAYQFLPDAEAMKEGEPRSRRENNLLGFLNHLWQSKSLLLYAQRDYVRDRFREFAQWELALKDTHCPWDWDHIYPRAFGRCNVDPVYKDWRDSIGILRAEGLSENRSDGCSWPTEKMLGKDADDGRRIRRNSFVPEEIWREMQKHPHEGGAILDDGNDGEARQICAIILKRMVAIYAEWHKELRVSEWMEETRSVINERHGDATSIEQNPIATS